MPDENIAFKCTYNDGGDRDFIGFEGTCTIDNIIQNIKKKRIWCSNTDNLCRQFKDRIFQGKEPYHPCYESQIFTNWSFGPGIYRSGDRAGTPIPMNVAHVGKVALLTTRHPDYDIEHQRIVFGAFKIVALPEIEGEGTQLRGETATAIRLPLSTALALPYWRFKAFPKSGKPDWRTGLFRSISDQEVSNFLHALNPLLQNAQDRMALEHLLECCGNREQNTQIENPNVMLRGADLKGKYGPGGEGERHRRLKNRIADNPDMLNMGPGTGWLEHSFVTGDRVDVLVDLANGETCVVEIEVEGQSTMVGAHQALKYRALRAGQLDMTRQPHAFLVAYSIPDNVKEFCRRHGVMTLEFPI